MYSITVALPHGYGTAHCRAGVFSISRLLNDNILVWFLFYVTKVIPSISYNPAGKPCHRAGVQV